MTMARFKFLEINLFVAHRFATSDGGVRVFFCLSLFSLIIFNELLRQLNGLLSELLDCIWWPQEEWETRVCMFGAWTSAHATLLPRNVYTSHRKHLNRLEYDDDDDFMMTNYERRKQFLFIFFCSNEKQLILDSNVNIYKHTLAYAHTHTCIATYPSIATSSMFLLISLHSAFGLSRKHCCVWNETLESFGYQLFWWYGWPYV